MMRNFWLEGIIEGRKTKVAGGPIRKDGGMSVTIYQRKEGVSTVALSIECFVEDDGTLKTLVIGPDCNRFAVRTNR